MNRFARATLVLLLLAPAGCPGHRAPRNPPETFIAPIPIGATEAGRALGRIGTTERGDVWGATELSEMPHKSRESLDALLVAFSGTDSRRRPG